MSSSYYYPRHHRAYSGNLSTYSPHTPTSSFVTTNRDNHLTSHYNTLSRPQSMYNNYLPNQPSHLSYQPHSPSYRQYSPTRELKNKVFSPGDENDDLSFCSPSDSSFLLNNSTSSQLYDNDNDMKASLTQSPSQTMFVSYTSPTKKKTLILDLDETLVHSSFKPFYSKPDIHLNIKFDNEYHNVYVLKRPYVDEFLTTMAKYYNIIIFTASIKEYANPLLDMLDKNKCIQQRLFRGDCKEKDGLFVKDLSVIRQHLKDLIIVDNNPVSYSVNVDNGIPIKTWHYDKRDCELERLVPLLKYLVNVDDVRNVIRRVVKYNEVDFESVKMMLQNERRDNVNVNRDNDNNIMNRSRSLDGLQRVSPHNNNNKMVNNYSYINNNNNSTHYKRSSDDEDNEEMLLNNNKSHCELNNTRYSAQSGNYTYRYSNNVRNNNNYYSISHSPVNNRQTINYNNSNNNNYITNRHNIYPQTTRYSSNSKNNTYYNSVSPIRIQLEETKQNSQLNIHNYHNHNMLNINSPNNRKQHNLFTPNTTSSSSAFSKETNYYIKRKMMNRQLSSNTQNTLVKNKNIFSNFSNISYIQPPNTPEWRMMSKRPTYSNQYLPFRYNN